GMFLIDLFESRRRLEAENLFLRHQLSIALRRSPSHLQFSGCDRALLVWMTRLWPGLLGVMQVVEPETILRWHRAGFNRQNHDRQASAAKMMERSGTVFPKVADHRAAAARSLCGFFLELPLDFRADVVHPQPPPVCVLVTLRDGDGPQQRLAPDHV